MPNLIENVNNTNDSQKKRLRQFFGYRTNKSVLDDIGGLDLGTTPQTRLNTAYTILAQEYNKDILEGRREKKIEMQKKKQEERKKTIIADQKAIYDNAILFWDTTLKKIKFGKLRKKDAYNKWGSLIRETIPFDENNKIETDVIYGTLDEKTTRKNLYNDVVKHYIDFIKSKLNESNFDYFYTPSGVRFEAPKTEEAGKTFTERVMATFNILDYTKFVEMQTEAKSFNETKIKLAGSINLDGFISNEKWDTNSNTCVPDWINYKYKDIKGFKKLVKDNETIQNLSILEPTCDNEYDNEYMNPNKYGYTLEHIKTFCFNVGIHLYALIDGQLFIYKNLCKTGVSLKKYPLVIEIKNNHLYPITDESTIKCIRNKAVNLYKASSSGNVFHEQKEVETKKELEKEYNKENLEPFDYIMKIMNDKNLMVYKNNITMINGRLVNFVLDKKKYIIDYDENIEQYFGDNYTGQTIISLLTPYIENIRKSYMTCEIQQALEIHKKKSAIKHRTHCDINYNFDIYDEDVKKYDINKCYRFIMADPLEEWMFLDFNSRVHNKNSYDGGFGLYYVETDDITLLHKTNWYSSIMIKKAIDEGIDLKIKYFINAYKGSKTLLKKIIDDIEDNVEDKKIIVDGKPQMYSPKKLLINAISGYMGKTKSAFAKLMVDKDQDRIWHNYFKKRQYENNKPYCKLTSDEYVFYGDMIENVLIENNLPMYIQILDQANILLYNKIKQTGGELVGRKTDAFMVYKPENVILSDDRGGLKEEEKKPVFPSIHEDVVYEYTEPNINNIDIYDSNDYQKIIDIIKEGKSIQLLGRAGTGKTYILQKIIQEFGDKCVAMSFTNKATLNLNGKTIHSFLKLDNKNKMCNKTIKHIKEHIDIIIIDEIGMIPSHLWKHLDYIKHNCDVVFVCAGCYRQLPPIEEMENNYDYFKHPIVLNICDNNVIELSTVKRYDTELLEKSNDVYEGRISSFNCVEFNKEDVINALQNICWFNKTRKIINKICNTHNADKATHPVLIPYEGEENKYNEDIILYKGCKLLANISDSNLNIRKNETYIVKDFDDENICLTTDEKYSELNDDIEYVRLFTAMADSKRSNSWLVDTPEAKALSDYIMANNIKIENPIIIKREKLHKYFILGYCITTYKSQGDTYKGQINIFESNKMFDDKRHIYTAMTRTDKFSNIKFMNI